MNQNTPKTNRRDFIKAGAAVTTMAALGSQPSGKSATTRFQLDRFPAKRN